MNSFTSSSSTSGSGLQQRSRVLRHGKRRRLFDLGLAGLVAFVIAAEVLFFRNVMFYGLSPGFIGQLGELEATFAHHGGERVRVAIFGDSQSMDALLPEHLAAESDYEVGEIFNFSLSGGSAYDMEQMWRKYRNRLPALEKVIIVVNEHQFNEARAVEDIKFRFFASLGERLQVIDQENYGDLLLGWALRSYEMRTVWTQMIEKWRAGELREKVPVHEGGLPPVTWSPSTDRSMDYARDTAERWFEDFKMGGVRSRAFERLVSELNASGVEVVILQLPRSSLFEQAIEERYAAERDAYWDYVQGIARQYGFEAAKVPNDELELDTHYRDTNHVNPQGAEWVSRYVARRWL